MAHPAFTTGFSGLLVAVVVGLVVAMPVVSSAQVGSETSLALSPSKFDFHIDAGKSVDAGLIVDTFGTQPIDAVLYAKPFSVKSGSYEQMYELQANQVDASSWVHLQTPSVAISGKGDRHTIPFTVSVPAGVPAGGYYAVLFAEMSEGAGVGSNTSIASKARVGSLVYITVNGAINTSGGVTGWSVPPVQGGGDTGASFTLTNNGNVHYTSRYTIRTRDIFNFGSTTYNGDTTVLPGTQRDVRTKWPNNRLFGIYKTEGTVEHPGGKKKLPQRIFVYISDSMY